MTILTMDAFGKNRERWFSPYSNSTVNLADEDYNISPHLFGGYTDDCSSSRWSFRRLFRPACIPIFLIFALICIIVLLPLWNGNTAVALRTPCTDTCRFSLVESIPEGLIYPPGSPSHPSTFDVWLNLIDKANDTIEIAAFYFYLTNKGKPDNFTSAHKGYEVYNSLLEAGAQRGIKIRIAENLPSERMPSVDSELLEKLAGADVRKLNFDQLMGAGVLHTKLWIVDRKHLYVGSANMDWRSLTQVKELGAVVYDCPCLADDMAKIFDVYWSLGVDGAKPPKNPNMYPQELWTDVNIDTPLDVKFNGSLVNTYLSSAPPPFCPVGRTQDLTSILNIIGAAKKFVYISVMDYLPLIVYGKHIRFWPKIDDALRTAAIDRQVEVRILIGYWKHTRKYEINFLKSLEAVNGTSVGANLKVKLFKVPATKEQEKIPYGRVNHSKFMVTDKTAYIGTSNWSGDYFIDTAGVGFIIDKLGNSTSTVREQLKAVFDRDWNSPYAKRLFEMNEWGKVIEEESDDVSLLSYAEF